MTAVLALGLLAHYVQRLAMRLAGSKSFSLSRHPDTNDRPEVRHGGVAGHLGAPFAAEYLLARHLSTRLMVGTE